MSTIYYIDLTFINGQELIDNLHKIGYEESYLSDISFCPYLIIYFDNKDKNTAVYENINKGFLNNLLTNPNFTIIEDKSVSDFLLHGYNLKTNRVNNSNSLF